MSERWGQGTVQRYDGDQVTVLFDEHGYRELFLPVVLERGLLRTVPGSASPQHDVGAHWARALILGTAPPHG